MNDTEVKVLVAALCRISRVLGVPGKSKSISFNDLEDVRYAIRALIKIHQKMPLVGIHFDTKGAVPEPCRMVKNPNANEIYVERFNARTYSWERLDTNDGLGYFKDFIHDMMDVHGEEISEGS